MDVKAFWPSCVLRSKLGVTDATAAVCSLGFKRKRLTAAAALHHAVLQHQHAAQHQHQYAVLLQHQHVVVLLQLHLVVVKHHLVVVAHDPVVVQHQQHLAADVALLLQFRPDAVLAEQLWMLAQSAPEVQHQPFQHLLLQHRLVTKLQQRKLFESFAIRSIKTGLHKNLDNRAAISIEIQLGFFVCIDLVPVRLLGHYRVFGNCLAPAAANREPAGSPNPAALPVKHLEKFS